jgi:hypothetical protein
MSSKLRMNVTQSCGAKSTSIADHPEKFVRFLSIGGKQLPKPTGV